MARPRKNPNDPKWNKYGEINPALQNVGSYEQVPTNDVKLILYAVSLAGVIAQGKPVSQEQAAKSAMEYAEAALKIWN
jgi:hypothetical protein